MVILGVALREKELRFSGYTKTPIRQSLLELQELWQMLQHSERRSSAQSRNQRVSYGNYLGGAL